MVPTSSPRSKPSGHLLALLPFTVLALLACDSTAPPETTEPAASPPQVASPLPWTDIAPPELPTDRDLRVGFLILDGVYNTELTAPFDIFHHARFHTEPAMEVFTVSPDGEVVTTFEGLRIAADYGFDDAPPIDVLVVPSAENNMGSDLEDEVLIDWVRRTGEQALFVMSLCDGAFVLAKAGLLDGLACTTFPGDQDRFAEMFPHLDLRRGPSFVHHGKAITSQGGARSFDPAMYLSHHLYGEKAAQGIGRGMVIDWPPAPGALVAEVVAPAAERAESP